MEKKIGIWLLSVLFLMSSCTVVLAAEYSVGTGIDIADEYGNYILSIDNAHDVDWNCKRDGVKFITVQGVAENIDYDRKDKGLSCYQIAQNAIQVQDDDGFDLEFYDISSGDDGIYEVSADIKPSSKKRISLPYYAPEDCETVTVVIDKEYSVTFSLDGSGVIENQVDSEDVDKSAELETSDDKETISETENILKDIVEENLETDIETEFETEEKESEFNELNADELVIESDRSDFLYVVNNGEVYIRSYNGKAANVVIPSEIDGGVVTTIGEKSFENNETIQSVTFPDTLTTIGSEAFHKCKNLQNVNFPVSKTDFLSIGNSAFSGCDISGEVIINAKSLEIGVSAFSLNYYITDFIILSDEIVFQDHPFSSCKSVKSFYIKPDASTTYDGYYINSDVGDVFTNMGALEEVFLNTDCGFLTENTFEDTPNAIIYVPEGSATLDSAAGLWLPTNTSEYEDKTSEILGRVSDLGYDLNDTVSDSEQIVDQGKPEDLSSDTSQNDETVKKVQEALNNLHFDCGTVDGVAGSQTQSAIQQYQVENGLEVNGEINDELLSSLGIE